MANKRQTFFSQYRGRGGPAIEPGIIQMMGSIGDEYAKGIREFGEAIGEGQRRREEEEKIRNENETWREIALGGTTPDTEKYNEDVMEQASDEMEAGERTELTKRESELASARAGQYDPLKHTREIQEELDIYKKKNIRMTLDYEDDFKFFSTIIENLKLDFSIKNVLNYIDDNPHVRDINYGREIDWKNNQGNP